MATEAQPPVDTAVALTPNNIEALFGLVKEIAADVDALASHGHVDRQALIIKCRSMVQALETPRETMVKHCWAQTGATAALNFGVDSGLWQLMAKNGDEPQRVADLAANLGVDPVLLGRLMRHLGAMGYLVESGENEYKPTNYSKAMSIPAIGGSYLAMLSGISAGPIKFHEYSRMRGWKNPTDSKDTSLMHAYGTDKDVFTWLQHLGYGEYFNGHMACYRLGRTPWMDPRVYPVKQRLIDGAAIGPDAPFLVDIGGNVGHDLTVFKRYYPDTPGRLILQDLPVVLGGIQQLDTSITRMEYDFHTEQPVKGARAYYIRSILHDWPDHVCESILSRIKEAMVPGYSRLLINEEIMPSRGANWEITALDMMMMSVLSSGERTTEAWYDLLEKRAGLKIVKIWSGGTTAEENIIECEIS